MKKAKKDLSLHDLIGMDKEGNEGEEVKKGRGLCKPLGLSGDLIYNSLLWKTSLIT